MSSHITMLSQLATEISTNAAILEDYLTRNNLPQPSFDAEAPIDLAIPASEEKVIIARAALVNASKMMYQLTVGPAEHLKWIGMNEIYLLTSLQVLCHFNVPQAIPLDSSISFVDLASKTGLSESFLARCFRMAATNHYFQEPRPGFAAHTAGSRLLAEDEGYRACVWLRAEEFFAACAKASETVKRFGDSAKPEEAPYAVAYGDGFFAHKDKEPLRREKFGHFMKSITSGNEVGEIAVVYDWQSVEEGGLVVDMGGGMTHISSAVATNHAHLRFVVEDLPGLAPQANAYISSLPESVSSRLTFQPHSFFDPQPDIARGAAVYFLRNIFHDWPDAHCQQILSHIVDAMGPKSRIVIVDILVPEPGVLGKFEEARVRQLDLTMWALFAAKERTKEDWERLLKSVNEKLSITQVIAPPRVKRDAVFEIKLVD